MMKLKFYITLACLSLAIAGNTQKIGYLNSVKFIDTLQEAKLLADQLLQYEKSLSETGEKMISKFQEDLKLYQKDQQAGTITPTAQKQKESDLQMAQEAIVKYQESAKASLDKRRLELTKPLLDKISKAIIEMGKEQGYMFIFDSSVGLLYQPEGEDISAKLMEKLNRM